MEPLISVILPIYNMERYLARCLDSIINNTYRNLEILCVDDGSCDATPEILCAYAEKDSRILVITKENGGVSSARNAGLDRMTGEYVTFIDPDDYVHPQYVELMFRALQETGTGIAICEYQKVDEKTSVRPEEIRFDPDMVQVYSFSHVFRVHRLRAYSGGRMIRSGLAAAVRFCQDLHYGEDTVFFAEVCEHEQAEKVSVVSKPLYYYFQREDSMTKTVSMPQRIQFIKTIIQKLLQSKGRDNIYLHQAIKDCLYYRYLSTHVHPDKESARECTGLLTSILGRIWMTDTLSLKEKGGYSVFILFPGLYRFRRIMKDPSTLEWEKAEREKFQEET